MKTLIKILLAAACIAATTKAGAVTIFSDDFNSENGGVGAINYAGFANWTVNPGTVDLIGNGFFDFYPGNGLFVDLDGSTSQAGKMTSSAIAVTPGFYSLSFMLGGNARGAANDTVSVSVDTGFANQNYVLNYMDPLTAYTLPFQVLSATSINLVFQNAGGDNVGAILDNVRLEQRDQAQVPDGGTSALLLGMGLLALGWSRKLTS